MPTRHDHPIPHTMMQLPLTLETILQRAEGPVRDVALVSRRADKTLSRSSWGEVAARARKLARALDQSGVKPGDRVATLMWNHAAHLEAYFGVPLTGAVLHTLNLRLHPDDIAYIANDAGDSLLLVDEVLLPLYEKFRAAVPFKQVIVIACGTAATIPTSPTKGSPTTTRSSTARPPAPRCPRCTRRTRSACATEVALPGAPKG